MSQALVVRLTIWQDRSDYIDARLATEIDDSLSSLYGDQAPEFPWSYLSPGSVHSSDPTHVKLEIRLKHKRLLKDEAGQNAAISILCDLLFAPSSRHALNKIYNGNDIGFSPSCEGEMSTVDKHGLLQDMAGIDGSFTTRNKTKWIRGPMNSLVRVGDAVQWLNEHMPAAIRPEGAQLAPPAKVASWLSILRFGAVIARLVNVACPAQLAKLDSANVNTALNKAQWPFAEAAGVALEQLRDLSTRHEISTDDLDKVIDSLNRVMRRAPPLLDAAYKKSDASFARFLEWGLAALLTGLATFAVVSFPPALLSAPLVLQSVSVGGAVASACSAGMTVKSGSDFYTSRNLSKRVHAVGQNSEEIWRFAVLLSMRASGVTSPTDENFAAFATKMSEVFDVDVVHWDNPGFTKAWFEEEAGRLQKNYDRLQKGVERAA